MRYFIILIIIFSLAGCHKITPLDFTNIVIACTNKYDIKDDLVYYLKNETSFESQSTGTIQYTFIDVFGNKRMINEFEVDNYNCSVVKTQDEFEKIISD